jgi:hypothetical protein
MNPRPTKLICSRKKSLFSIIAGLSAGPLLNIQSEVAKSSIVESKADQEARTVVACHASIFVPHLRGDTLATLNFSYVVARHAQIQDR